MASPRGQGPRHGRDLHLRPRRDARRPLDARQVRLLRPVLPRAADHPRSATPGRPARVDAFTEAVDIMPTLLELAGGQLAGPSRRLLARPVPRRRDALRMARCGSLGIRFPRGRDRRGRALLRPRHRSLLARRPSRRALQIRPLRRPEAAPLRSRRRPRRTHRPEHRPGLRRGPRSTAPRSSSPGAPPISTAR